jgi:hypothetical protein
MKEEDAISKVTTHNRLRKLSLFPSFFCRRPIKLKRHLNRMISEKTTKHTSGKTSEKTTEKITEKTTEKTTENISHSRPFLLIIYGDTIYLYPCKATNKRAYSKQRSQSELN